MQITVDLPRKIYDEAERLANQTGQELEDILLTALEISLPTLTDQLASESLESLPDDKLLELVNSQMSEQQNARMSELLAKQQDTQLDPFEARELAFLVYVYEEGSLRKIKAMTEAVKRGIYKLSAS